MADKKISELVSITGSATAADDYFVVVDTSGAVTHKISREELNNAIEQDVLSSIEITDITNDVNVQGTVTADGLTVDGTSTLQNVTVDVDGTYGGNYRTIGFSGNTNGSTRIFGTTDDSDNLYIAAGTGRGINFWVDGSSSTVLKVESSGRVGIGTASPGYKLSILENANNFLQFSQTGDSVAGSLIGRSSSKNLRIQQSENAPIEFWTNNTERMRLDSSGNLKIGTTTNAWSGSNTLVIKEDSGDGGITLVSSSTSNNMNIGFADTETSSFADMRGLITYLHASDAMRFMTANTEAMRIDSSGNVLVGTTSSNYASVGSQLGVGGSNYMTRSNAQPLLLNRLTSDGDIALFMKDGTTVGSIGVASTDNFYFAAADGAGLKVDSDLSSGVTPCNSSGADLDASINIGHASARWNNLYLSGGVYLGGTGSANYLDDYEEGTWNVTIVNGGLTPSVTSASYTKIGNRVFLSCHLVVPTNSESLYMALGGLPFSTSGDSGGSLGYTTATTSGSIGLLVQSSTIYFYKDGTPYATSEFSNKQLRLSAQYRTV